MADTHPNAFRAEATDLRTQANQLSNKADELDAKASELEKELDLPNTAPSTTAVPSILPASPIAEDQLPPKGQIVDPETDTGTEKKSKVPFKK